MPLLNFEEALRASGSDAARLDAVLESVDAELSSGASPSDLKKALDEFEAESPLPNAIRGALLQRIRSAELHAEAETVILNTEDRDAADATEAAAPPASELIGSVLADRYRIEELIGQGGMSLIYKAIDLLASPGTADRYVAVKLFVRHLADLRVAYPAIAADFKKLQSLSHPNIVRLFECGLHEGSLFLVMEYLPGESLYARMHGEIENRPSRRQKLDVVEKLTDALEYSHQHAIVHGDLKPGNVLVREDEIKIIDFSIAGLTAPTMPLALTPRYASPQLLSRQRTESTDDVYSLACIAYELLTGRHPREGDYAAHPAVFPPPANPELTDGQYRAIVHGLEPDRARRTISAGQFREEWLAAPVDHDHSKGPSKSPSKGLWVAAAFIFLAVGLYAGRAYLVRPAHVAAPPTVPSPSASPLPAAGATIRDCADCPVMKVLPAGKLLQGERVDDPKASPFEKPQHWVSIARAFAMSEDSVTVEQFEEFAAATARGMSGCDVYDGSWHVDAHASWREPGFRQTLRHPVVCVSWNDAVAYAAWLSKKSGHLYRLPSSAEWEYAARAGQSGATPWGDEADRACRSANVADESAKHAYPAWTVFACSDGYVNTAPVESFAANAYGLYDMLGNVFVWNQDCWRGDYVNAPSDGSARLDANCSEHELRGGSWFSAPAYIRASYRNHFAADYRVSTAGFRLVRELSP